jgi:hypothetical protein
LHWWQSISQITFLGPAKKLPAILKTQRKYDSYHADYQNGFFSLDECGKLNRTQDARMENSFHPRDIV